MAAALAAASRSAASIAVRNSSSTSFLALENSLIDLPRPRASSGSFLPPRLATICRKALAPEKEHRYQAVSELRKELEEFIHGTARLPEQTFQPGEVIIKEGEPGDCAYIILDGHCQVTRVVAGKK